MRVGGIKGRTIHKILKNVNQWFKYCVGAIIGIIVTGDSLNYTFFMKRKNKDILRRTQLNLENKYDRAT